MLNFKFFKLSFLVKLFFSFALISFISLGLSSCNKSFKNAALDIKTISIATSESQLSEVPPPDTILVLNKILKNYHPKVTIDSPRPYEVLSDNTVLVKLQLTDYPLFKNEKLELGPHLRLFVDDKFYKDIYDLNEPIILKDLDPGTHTIRVLTSTPWNESFKSKEAYAQTSFHIFTKIDHNLPNLTLPLLTYNGSQGDYGEETIMLDFYLFNPSSDLLESHVTDNQDINWRIKVTINGEIFILDSLETIYIKGLQPGKNWIRLELVDKYGRKINNIFNDSIQLLNYNPNKKDMLSTLLQGKLSNQLAYSLINREYMEDLESIDVEEILVPVQPKEITAIGEDKEVSRETSESIDVEEILVPVQPKEITTIGEDKEVSRETSESIDVEEMLVPIQPKEITTIGEDKEVSRETSESNITLSKKAQWLKNLKLLIKKVNLDTIKDFMNNI